MLKRNIYITLILFFMAAQPVLAARYEGEIVKVNPDQQSFLLATTGGQKIFRLAKGARLYYNSAAATLEMYTPVTDDDFVSGYLETDSNGLVISANFYYLIREGLIEDIQEGRLALADPDSGVVDTYMMNRDTRLYLNHLPAAARELKPGMRALVVLDYRYTVKKIAIFHYDYSGFVTSIDLPRQSITVNTGTRLTPNPQEFRIGGTLTGADGWETLPQLLRDGAVLFVKFTVDQTGKQITAIEIRSI